MIGLEPILPGSRPGVLASNTTPTAPPQGLEPRLPDPESGVLPLHYRGSKKRAKAPDQNWNLPAHFAYASRSGQTVRAVFSD